MSEGWTSPFEARKQDSHEVQQREVQNPVPGKEKTQATLQAGDQPAEKQLYRKGPGSPGRHKIEHQPALHTCSRRGPAASEAALEEALPADWRQSSFPFIENWWDTQSAGSSSGLPTARQTRSNWSESSKGARAQREIEEIPYKYRENFYCEGAETDGASSLVLDLLKTQPKHVPEKPALTAPELSRLLDYVIAKRCFPPVSVILSPHEIIH